MGFVVSILLFAVSIIPIRAIFQIKTKIATILALYLVWYSLTVFTAEISGFLGLLSKQWSFLLLQTLETLIIWGIWWKKGRPILFEIKKDVFIDNWAKLLLSKIRNNKLISLIGVLITSGYGVLAWLIIRVPPNNSDSMHTHLARVIYWLQQGSFNQLTSNSIFAKIYPFDAQLNLLWTILFTGTDKFVGFVQFFATIFCAISIYGICRLLNGGKKYSFLVSLIWLTFPLVVYQATSTQFDLVITALFMTSVFFFFAYFKNPTSSSLFFSALGFGLSLGTKQTVFMMVPAYAIILGILVVKNNNFFSPMLRWVIIAFLSFILLGSYTYFNNLNYYHNPFGPSNHVTADSFGKYSFIDKLKYNSPRFFYQFSNFDSLPVRIAIKGNNLKNIAFKYLDTNLNLQMESNNALKDLEKPFSLDSPVFYNEDESWFGIGAVLLIIPAFIAGIIIGFRKKDLISGSLVLFGISFYLMEILLRPGWDPYQGRYFILSIAILIPLVIHLFKKSLLSRAFQLLICLIVSLTFFMAVFSNESKPILGKKAFEYTYQTIKTNYFPESRILQIYKEYSLKLYYVVWDNLPFQKPISFYDDTELRVLSSLNHHLNIVNEVNKLVPTDARLGLMLVNGDFDYVFFGSQLTRILINVFPESEINNLDWIKEQNISYILIADKQRIQIIPSYLKLISDVDGWGLYSVSTNP